jgi:hypothetical protein
MVAASLSRKLHTRWTFLYLFFWYACQFSDISTSQLLCFFMQVMQSLVWGEFATKKEQRKRPQLQQNPNVLEMFVELRFYFREFVYYGGDSNSCSGSSWLYKGYLSEVDIRFKWVFDELFVQGIKKLLKIEQDWDFVQWVI